MRNFPTAFQDGEEVCATEKAHGSNARCGVCDGELMAGSHTTRKKRPADEDMKAHFYWLPMTIPGVKPLLDELGQGHKQVILFGETYGAKVQSLHYGHEKDRAFIAFDILVDGKYLDYDEFKGLCDKYAIPTCPVIYRGPFSLAAIKTAAEGKTIIGGDHIREGVVVRPVKERNDPRIGRLVLKYLSEAYLLSKHADQDLRDV